MLKKLLPVLICLVIALNTNAVAETTTEVSTEITTSDERPAFSEDMPIRGRNGRGGRGDMMPPDGEMPQGQMPPQGEMQPPDGEMPPQGDMALPTEGEDTANEFDMYRGQGRIPGGDMNGKMPTSPENTTEATQSPVSLEDYSTTIISIILLISAFVFVKLYKRRHY